MVSLGWCHVQNIDMSASYSSRTTRLRAPGGLVWRKVKYNKLRAYGNHANQLLARTAIQANAVTAENAGRSSATLAEEPNMTQEQDNNGAMTNGTKASTDGLGTLTVHAGERHGRPNIADSLTTPVCMTATYTFNNTQEVIDYNEGRLQSFEYGRYGNHTTRVLEQKLAALEGADDCCVSASGMNTATTLLLTLVPAGGHIITTTDCYRRTRQFIQTMLPRMGITFTIIDPSDLGALEAALASKPTSLFFSESPTNPYLRCVDVERVVGLCHAHGAIVVLDGTFATPINFRPIEWGCDLVIHSATKYIGGHNDVLGGTIAGRQDLVDVYRKTQAVLGGVMDPHAAYLHLRGLKTLHLRVARQNATALELAKRLSQHPKVDVVHYPGLPCHPDHAVAKKYLTGYGGVISFEVKGDGLWEAARLIDNVRIPYIAPSLGGVESLIEQPAVISYWDQGLEGRQKVGIKENLIRYSCGIESVEDLWVDLEQGLDKV